MIFFLKVLYYFSITNGECVKAVYQPVFDFLIKEFNVRLSVLAVILIMKI